MECSIGNCNETATKGVTWEKNTWYSCERHVGKMRIARHIPSYIDTHNVLHKETQQDVNREGFFLAVEVDDISLLDQPAKDLLIMLMQNLKETVGAINKVEGTLKMSVSMSAGLMSVALGPVEMHEIEEDQEDQEEDSNGV